MVFAIETSKLIDQRALPRPRRPGQAEDERLATVRKYRLQQLGPSWGAILHGRNGSGKRSDVAGTELVNPCLDVLAQTVSVKQRKKKMKC
jgi:hypothetical protein